MYFLNRTLLSDGRILTEEWHKKELNLSDINVFGTFAYVHVPKEEGRKLGWKSERIMMDYANGGYCVLNPTTPMKISRDVVFDEIQKQKLMRKGPKTDILKTMKLLRNLEV